MIQSILLTTTTSTTNQQQAIHIPSVDRRRQSDSKTPKWSEILNININTISNHHHHHNSNNNSDIQTLENRITEKRAAGYYNYNYNYNNYYRMVQ